MDDRLQKGLDHANYRAALHQQRLNLQARLENALLVAHNGGVFTVDRSLISFVDTLIRHGDESAILLDDRKTPIFVENLKDFLDQIVQAYHEALNEYRAEFEKLSKARSVKAAVGLA